MFEIIGKEFDYELLESDDWFMRYSWSAEQRQSFENWLFDYFHQNREARIELMKVPNKDRRRCRKAAQEFMFIYGWNDESKSTCEIE